MSLVNIRSVLPVENDYFNGLSEALMSKEDTITSVKTMKTMNRIDLIEAVTSRISLQFVPAFAHNNVLFKYNYTLVQLKRIAKHYHLRLLGNKTQLISRIYSFLHFSNVAIIIQRRIRGILYIKYLSCRGPALIKRNVCVDHNDFLTMDTMEEIDIGQFFSFKDEEGFIYGFDILSLYNLIYKSGKIVKNPYNTKIINMNVITTLRTLLRMGKILQIPILTQIKNGTGNISNKKAIELRTLALFQNIDALGNYSNAQWFLKLNNIQLINMYINLKDIWAYRANLTVDVKNDICPPMGNPFTNYPHINQLRLEPIDSIRGYMLVALEKLVNSGINNDFKCLGAYYVLGALTLVSSDAALSLPWLYQSLH